MKIQAQLSFSENGDDDIENAEQSSTTERLPTSEEEERDEVKEVKRLAEKDTKRLRLLRLAVTGALLLTALAVSLTSYKILDNEEEKKFETAFNQFSKTVADAALNDHRNRIDAYSSLADIVSSIAHVNNATWPYFTFPRFEHFGHNAITQSKTEIVNIVHKVVAEEEEGWVQFANDNYEKWLDEGYHIESHKKPDEDVYANTNFGNYHPYITQKEEDFVPREKQEIYWTSWVYSPPPVTDGFINWDFTSSPIYKDIIKSVEYLKNETLFTNVKTYVSAGIAFTKEEHDAMHSKRLDGVLDELPHAFLFHPIHRDPDDKDSEVVAVLCSGMAWDNSLIDLLPEDIRGLYVVIENNCDQQFTFLLNGRDATFLGNGDFHDREYDSMRRSVSFRPDEPHAEYDTVGGHCVYSMTIYPSEEFEETWNDNTSVIFAVVVSATFLLIILVFLLYDLSVQRRNNKLIERAARATGIISNLFPGQFRDQMIANTKLASDDEGKKNRFLTANSPETEEGGGEKEEMPLAKHYPDVTVLFADIVGFTAWSSTKQPHEVFELLEKLYNAFDDIATARRVFKVETVGDCYVAACGIPAPNPHHAVAMCRFARNIRSSMHVLTRELMTSLGPETSELDLRVGIHSGSVTAGVIRGQKARFQLFGDTMNTCSRIETSGKPGKIHLSQATADLLEASGKKNWVALREDVVSAKGKGDLQTYWLVADQTNSSSSRSSKSNSSTASSESGESSPSTARTFSSDLVDWSVNALVNLLIKVEDARHAAGPQNYIPLAERTKIHQMERGILMGSCRAMSSISEFRTMLTVPKSVDAAAFSNAGGLKRSTIPENVVEQLRLYMTCIANMHRAEDKFHTFEHAVTVAKTVYSFMSGWNEPWTLFGCVWAALVHHVDHPGHGAVATSPLAAAYGHRVVAEQNSLVLSWKLLLEEKKFTELRNMMYKTCEEAHYFRQVTVNAILATDLFDKELHDIRERRWEQSFASDPYEDEEKHHNLQLTAVVDVFVSASNVIHTMQSWKDYIKWNRKLFQETYLAFQDGRTRSNPADNWHLRELEFFDTLVIPLAKKVEESIKLLGQDTHGKEYYVSALKNREALRDQGAEMVQKFLQELKRK